VRSLATRFCGALAGLAIASAPGAASTRPMAWANETMSPRPTGHDAPLLAACPETDRALDAVAAEIARGAIAVTDVEALTYALRAAGEPHVRPKALVLRGAKLDSAAANQRLLAWLEESPTEGRARCGVAVQPASPGNEDVIAVLAVGAQADLTALPTRARTSSWIDVDARALVPASGATVVALGPRGAPRKLPTSFSDGRVRARANVDQPGPWLFQVVLQTERGPAPVLEAYVFAGVEPGAWPSLGPAPGEGVSREGDASQTLERMVAEARASESLRALVRMPSLDRIATAHAERMMRASRLAHDAGDGDPVERVDAAGIAVREVGENIAHAPTLALAHRALWSSPSHRSNLLEPRFERLGVGVVTGADGSVWATELFAR
jgi:uncharacterized protein YkwD